MEWGSSSDSWGLDAVVRVVEERERVECKACAQARRDEKCTDSTFKSIRRRMLSLDGKRRVHSAQWVSTPKETRVGRKKVSSGRLPLLIGREFLDTYRLLFCLACYLSTLVSNVFRKRCSPSSGIFELCPLRVFVSSLFRIRSTSFCLISFDNSVGGEGS